jgi:VWFA-related protein
MRLYRFHALAAVLFLASGVARGQQAAQAPADPSVIRTETKLVLVDAVVTDKKGSYVHDLTVKDFRVWEDNKEQTIKNFSFEADPASPSNSQPRYLVLFFDNASMNFADQAQARKAATQFIEKNAGPNRLMAIVNYGGSIQIAQNFTADADRLKAVASGTQFALVPTNASTISGMPGLSRAAGDYGVRDVILALRSLARDLASVQGRKTLIMLTSGFKVPPEDLSEVSATIDACNKANVAIYPIDVRGLVTPPTGGPNDAQLLTAPSGSVSGISAFLRPASFTPGSMAFFAGQQTGGRGGGGAPGGAPGGTTRGGGSPGAPVGGRGGAAPPAGGTAGKTGATTGTTLPGMSVGGLPPNVYSQARNLIPKFPDSASTNQEIMHMLADGTGGFVIQNTNDLVAGLEKIGMELNEFYLLGYTPPESDEGSCHTLRVKSERAGTNVRARTGYCNVRSRDMLAQKPVVKTLENRAAAQQAGDITASLQLPFFYTSADVARVNVAMEIEPKAMKFGKEKGKQHSEMNVLGIAYRPDGSVGARFSDTVKFDFENKKDVDAFNEKPYHYENQFDVAPGQYRFKVVFSSGGESFGKLEKPLSVETYDGKTFKLSGIAFSTVYRAASSMGTDLDAALIDDRTPLITQGVQLFPSGSTRFKTTDKPAIYLEVYEPLLAAAEPPKDLAVALQLKVLDVKSGEQKVDSGLFRIPVPEKGGSPAIPAGAQVPVATLGPGSYRLVMSATDSAGKQSQRWADFEVQ